MKLVLPVKSTDKVLEIGSGHNPHPRSDILVDRYLQNDTERQRKPITIDRPLVIADAHSLPFTDKSFDFVLCQQVLEHSAQPKTFVSELERVAKAGLLVVPHASRERMFGWPYHRWYFYQTKNSLWYLSKTPKEENTFAHFTHTIFAHSVSFRRFLQQYEKDINTYYFWKKSISLKRSRRNKAIFFDKIDTQVQNILQQFRPQTQQDIAYWFVEKYQAIQQKYQKYKRIRQWNQRIKQEPSYAINRLLPLLSCPVCRHPVDLIEEGITCTSCEEVFGYTNGIPIMLPKSQRKQGV